MIPQIGFMEMMVLAILAIVVVGPEDLPKLMRSIGQFMARIRRMGQEFKDAFDEMGAQGEMAELRREIEELKKMGKLEGIDDDMTAEIRDINSDIREGTDLSNPKAPPGKPEDAS